MPGPGFFSSPERPTGAYNAARYPSPGALINPPRPGFVGTIAAPTTVAKTPPTASIAAGTYILSKIIKINKSSKYYNFEMYRIIPLHYF